MSNAIAPIVWYEIVAVSDEFLEQIRAIPEMSTAHHVNSEGKVIQGVNEVVVVESPDQLKSQFEDIVTRLADPERPNIRIIERSTICNRCLEDRKKNPEKSIARCPHNSTRSNRAWNLDTRKLYSKA